MCREYEAPGILFGPVAAVASGQYVLKPFKGTAHIWLPFALGMTALLRCSGTGAWQKL